MFEFFIRKESALTPVAVWTQAPPPPPPPPPPCPKPFKPHAGGYWKNTDPCPHNDWSHCKEDSQNHTLALCGAKCTHTAGCVAFEVFMGQSCYIFVGGMTPPFTAAKGAVTCVKA